MCECVRGCQSKRLVKRVCVAHKKEREREREREGGGGGESWSHEWTETEVGSHGSV